MSKTRNVLLWIVGLFPVAFFAFVVLRYSVNVPWFDDFDPFPDFLRKWIGSEGFISKLNVLFQPNNEHRMVFGKGLAALYYALTGQLNFTFLHIAGMLFTFGTLLIIWRAFRASKLPGYLFLPVPFLLFQLQYHLIFLWAICSLQHQPVVFFVCLTMFLLARRQFDWAVLAALCANFAMSNGIFVWVGGAAILLLQTRYRHLAAWLGTGALAVFLYFSGMSSQGNESSFDFFLQNPHLSFLGFFAFLGGLFDFTPERAIQVRTALPIVMGILVMVWVGVWLLNLFWAWFRNTVSTQKNRKDQETYSSKKQTLLTRFQLPEDRQTLGYFCLGMLMFSLANAAVIGLLRPRFGFFVMVVSNYKLYPALFLVVSYLSFLTSTHGNLRERGFRIVLVTSLLIWGLTLVHYGPAISERRKYLLTNAYDQQHHAFGLGFVPGSPAAGYIDTLMHDLTDRDIYQYPAVWEAYFSQMKTLNNPLPTTLNLQTKPSPEGLTISAPDLAIPGGFDTGAYAFLRKGSELYVFKMEQRKYLGRNLFRRYDAHGAEVTVPKAALPPGRYQLGLMLRGGTQPVAGLAGTVEVL